MSKFFIIATLLSFLLVICVVGFGFKSFNDMSHGRNSASPYAIVNYANQAVAKLTAAAAPILYDLGIDVQRDFVHPKDRVEQELNKASALVNEATQKITQ